MAATKQHLQKLNKQLLESKERASKLALQKAQMNSETISKKEAIVIMRRQMDRAKLELEHNIRAEQTLAAEIRNIKSRGLQEIKNGDDDELKMIDERNVMRMYSNLLFDESKKIDRKYLFKTKGMGTTDENEDDKMYETAIAQSVTVKHVRKIKTHDSAATKEEFKTFLQKFRVSAETKFGELKHAACEFWKVKESLTELVDEVEALIPENERIEEFYRAKGGRLDNVLVQLIFKIDTVKLSPGIVNILNFGDKNKVIDDVKLSRKKEKEPNAYEDFFEEFPGMADYIDSSTLIQSAEKKEEPELLLSKRKGTRKIHENHVCLLFWLFVLFWVLIGELGKYLDIFYAYTTASSFQILLNIDTDIQKFDVGYDSVHNYPDFITYMGQSVFSQLFPFTTNDKSRLLYQQNTFVGPVRMRQIKTRFYTQAEGCKDFIGYEASTGYDVKCYFSNYNSDTVGNFNLQTPPFPWRPWVEWHDETYTQSVGYKKTGIFGTYDGTGYIEDFFAVNETVSSVQQKLAIQFNENYFGRGTRVILITFALYNHQTDAFLRVEIGWEFSVAGTAYPLTPAVALFKPNRTIDGGFAIGNENIKLAIVIFLIFFIAYMLVTDEEGKFSLNLPYLISFTGILNILIVGTVLGAYITGQDLDKKGILSSQLVDRHDFKGLGVPSELYNSVFDFEAFAAFLLIVRLIYFLKMFKNYRLFWTTLEKTGSFLIKYIIAIIPVIFGFAIVGMILFGPFSLDFATVGDSFESIIALFIGQFSSDVYDKSDSAPLVVFLTIFYLFQMFLITTFFAAIYIDSYRTAATENGLINEEEEAKTRQGFCEWALDWGPYSIFGRLLEAEGDSSLENKKKKTLGDKIILWLKKRLSRKPKQKPGETDKKRGSAKKKSDKTETEKNLDEETKSMLIESGKGPEQLPTNGDKTTKPSVGPIVKEELIDTSKPVQPASK